MKFTSILAAVATLASVPAAAQFVTYTDRGTFNGAAGSIVTEDFQSCTGTNGVSGTLSSLNPGNCTGLLGGISYQALGGDLYIAGPGQSSNPTTALGVNLPLEGNNAITFLNGTTAFGADFNQNFGGGGQGEAGATFGVAAFDINGGLIASFAFSGTPGAPVFWGLTTGGIVLGSINIRQIGGYAVTDNVSFTGTAGPAVPEPASWAMLIAGFGLVGAMSRRRRAVAA
jgi:hypothetical protein